ncbi:hypothetical protein GCM10028868_23430 [Virgibacillus kimchii]
MFPALKKESGPVWGIARVEFASLSSVTYWKLDPLEKKSLRSSGPKLLSGRFC